MAQEVFTFDDLNPRKWSCADWAGMAGGIIVRDAGLVPRMATRNTQMLAATVVSAMGGIVFYSAMKRGSEGENWYSEISGVLGAEPNWKPVIRGAVCGVAGPIAYGGIMNGVRMMTTSRTGPRY